MQHTSAADKLMPVASSASSGFVCYVLVRSLRIGGLAPSPRMIAEPSGSAEEAANEVGKDALSNE
jgi:hypothetical protein